MKYAESYIVAHYPSGELNLVSAVCCGAHAIFMLRADTRRNRRNADHYYIWRYYWDSASYVWWRIDAAGSFLTAVLKYCNGNVFKI